MYSVYEKLLQLCPVIKDLLIEEGMLKTGAGGAGLNQEELEQQS